MWLRMRCFWRHTVPLGITCFNGCLKSVRSLQLDNVKFAELMTEADVFPIQVWLCLSFPCW